MIRLTNADYNQNDGLHNVRHPQNGQSDIKYLTRSTVSSELLEHIVELAVFRPSVRWVFSLKNYTPLQKDVVIEFLDYSIHFKPDVGVYSLTSNIVFTSRQLYCPEFSTSPKIVHTSVHPLSLRRSQK